MTHDLTVPSYRVYRQDGITLSADPTQYVTTRPHIEHKVKVYPFRWCIIVRLFCHWLSSNLRENEPILHFIHTAEVFLIM